MPGESQKSQNVHLDAAGRIDEMRYCLRCNYNLRTLLPDGQCPECGFSVAASLDESDPLRLKSRWLSWLAAGSGLLAITVALILGGSFTRTGQLMSPAIITAPLGAWLMTLTYRGRIESMRWRWIRLGGRWFITLATLCFVIALTARPGVSDRVIHESFYLAGLGAFLITLHGRQVAHNMGWWVFDVCGWVLATTLFVSMTMVWLVFALQEIPRVHDWYVVSGVRLPLHALSQTGMCGYFGYGCGILIVSITFAFTVWRTANQVWDEISKQ